VLFSLSGMQVYFSKVVDNFSLVVESSLKCSD